MENTLSRSLVLDVRCNDELYKSVLDSIRRYRHACRQLYAALLTAQVVGATIVETDESLSLVPDGDQGKIALAAALGSARIEKGAKTKGEGQAWTVAVGSAFGYEMREWFLKELMPSSMAFVWDSARRDVVTVWTSRDPEHTRASRGWLAMQGARGIAQFQRRAIGFPAATARPKLSPHAVLLKWDHELGPIEFKVGTLDPGRWRVWQRVVEGNDGDSLGTIFLGEREGTLRLTVSYSMPQKMREPYSPARVLNVVLRETDEGTTVSLEGPEGAQDVIRLDDAIGMLERLKKQRELWEKRRAACGSPSKPWGFRKGWRGAQTHLSRVTLHRERFQTDCNHAWTRRICDRAVAWECGTVYLAIPNEGILGDSHPWQWSQFRQHLTYKLGEIGAKLVVEKGEVAQTTP